MEADETASAPCPSAKKNVSISGHERPSPGIKLVLYTQNHQGKGVIESSGICPFDVQLKLEGESGPLGSPFHLQFAVHMGATIPL